MRILYIHQYFKTPQEGGAIRSYYLAKAFVDAGCKVELITTHNSKEFVLKNVEGINVHYLPVTYRNQFGFVRRALAFLKFIHLASVYALKFRADLCYATSTPLSVGAIALWLKWRKKIPYVFEVRDLWPEAPVQLGILNNFLLKNLMRRFEKLIYTRAEKIVCLSPGIENDIKKRFLYLDTLRVPNMADCSFFTFEPKDKSLLKKFDVAESQFVVSYFGAVGLVNHLEYLLDAALFFQKKKAKVKFFIAGKGSELKKISAKANDLGLKNTVILGHASKYEIRDLLNISDAAYISFLQSKILETNSPNKFFDALAAGKIVVTNTKGWIKDLIDKNECGFYANPDSPEEFYNKLQPYLTDENFIEQTKLNSRKLAQDNFSRDSLSRLLVSNIIPHDGKKGQSIGL